MNNDSKLVKRELGDDSLPTITDVSGYRADGLGPIVCFLEARFNGYMLFN